MSTDNVVEQQLPPRKGWQLPHSPSGPAGPAPGPTQPNGSGPAPTPAAPTLADTGPAPTLRDSVIGQVANVTIGSVTVNDTPEAIVMLRLERHDPHAGRTSIYDVRLDGDDTIGFASAGDWIEAVGKRKSSHLRAVEAVNHTTGAVYKPSAVRRHKMLAATILFLVIAATMVTIFIVAVHRGDASFQRQVKQDDQEFQQRSRQSCQAAGLPESLCNRVP